MFNFADQFFKYAQVAELVDALDSKSSDFGRVGSIPTLSTKGFNRNVEAFFISQVQHRYNILTFLVTSFIIASFDFKSYRF